MYNRWDLLFTHLHQQLGHAHRGVSGARSLRSVLGHWFKESLPTGSCRAALAQELSILSLWATRLGSKLVVGNFLTEVVMLL